jgi:plastocyanin domain-containing protein
MSKNWVYLIGIVVMIAIGAFFLFHTSDKETVETSATEAVVDMGAYQKAVLSIKNGNYYPNTISVEAGKPVRIYLDNSVLGCYRSFTIKSFGISKNILTDKDYVEFTPTKSGSYGFSFSMGMGHGTLIVK